MLILIYTLFFGVIFVTIAYTSPEKTGFVRKSGLHILLASPQWFLRQFYIPAEVFNGHRPR